MSDFTKYSKVLKLNYKLKEVLETLLDGIEELSLTKVVDLSKLNKDPKTLQDLPADVKLELIISLLQKFLTNSNYAEFGEVIGEKSGLCFSLRIQLVKQDTLKKVRSLQKEYDEVKNEQ